jgi:hypothetical protein
MPPPFERAEFLGSEGTEGAEGFSRERSSISDYRAYYNPVFLMVSVSFCTHLNPTDAGQELARGDRVERRGDFGTLTVPLDGTPIVCSTCSPQIQN